MGKNKNKNKNVKSANAANSANSSIPSTSTPDAPIKDNPVDLLQRLTNYIQAEETDSSALKSQIQLLKKELQNSQEETRESRINVEHLEFEAHQLQFDSQMRIEIIQNLQEQLKQQTFKLKLEEKTLKETKEKFGKEKDELESRLQDSMKLNQEIRERQIVTINELTRIQEEYVRLALLQNEQSSMTARSQDLKVESDNLRDTDLNALSEAFNAKCNDCNLLSVRVAELERKLTLKNESIEKSSVGIFEDIRLVTEKSGLQVPMAKYTPQQLEMKEIWMGLIRHMLKTRITNQEEYRALVEQWHSTFTSQDTLDIALVHNLEVLTKDDKIKEYVQIISSSKKKMGEIILKKDQKITGFTTELSKQKMKMLDEQEKLLASHSTAIAGMEAQIHIKIMEEKRKQEKLNAAHKNEIDILTADFESQNMKREEEYQPFLEIAESILAREREKNKPHSKRNEEIIDRGNLAAHGGNCLAVLRFITSTPNDGDNEWFEGSYGVSIERFTRHQDCQSMRKLLDMRYEMSKFKIVPPFETGFEKNFQLMMKKVGEWEDHFEQTLGQPTESLQTFLDEDEDEAPIFSLMCQEYDEAAEKEKNRRHIEWRKMSGWTMSNLNKV